MLRSNMVYRDTHTYTRAHTWSLQQQCLPSPYSEPKHASCINGGDLLLYAARPPRVQCVVDGRKQRVVR